MKNDDRVMLWTNIIHEWLEFRMTYEGSMRDADDIYIKTCKEKYPDIKISYDILMRKYHCLENENTEGLLDKRQGKKGPRKLNPNVWNYFITLYSKPDQLPLTKCHAMTVEWAKTHYPDYVVPCRKTFYDYITIMGIKTLPIQKG